MTSSSSHLRRRADVYVSIATALFSVLMLSSIAFKGWGPQDAGTLGNAANGVLEGGLPHVDFKDVYPGLQAYFHGAFFALFRSSIWTLRIAWLVVVGLTAGSLYFVVRDVTSRAVGALAAFGAVSVAFVFYPVSMPTWWNVMFAAASLAMIQRGFKLERPVYMAVAGLLTGVSLLVKPTAVLVAIPSFLWVLSRTKPRPAGSLEVSATVGAVVIGWVVSRSLSPSSVLLVLIPVLTCIVWIWVSRAPREASIRGSLSEGNPPAYYGAGVLLPAFSCALYYALVGELPALIQGWVVSPSERWDVGSVDIPIAVSGLLFLGLAALGLWSLQRRYGDWVASLVFVAGVGFLGIAFWLWFPTILIFAALWLPLVISVSGLVRTRSEEGGDFTVLVVSVGVVFAAVQIPLWSGVYTAYTLPLLAAGAVLIWRRQARLVTVLVVCAGMMLVMQANRDLLYQARPTAEAIQWVELEPNRGGIRIPVWHAHYNDLTQRVSAISGGSAVYAGPDAPEVVFLAEVPGAGFGPWEALDPDWSPEEVVALAGAGVPVIVNHNPSYSMAIPRPQLQEIYDALPLSESFGDFELRWRDSASSEP